MISKKIIDDIFFEALAQGGDFAEIFVEDRMNNSIGLIGGKVEQAMRGRDFGIGIRIFFGLNSVYTYTNDLSKDNLIAVVRKAAYAGKGQKTYQPLDFTLESEQHHPVLLNPMEVPIKDKVEKMHTAYDAAKGYSDLISQVSVRYIDYVQKVLIANTEGVFVEDTRTRTRLSVSSVASRANEMQTGSSNIGGHVGFELYNQHDLGALGRETARIATTMLDAKFAPSGKMPVIIDNGFGGVLFHEACGHGLEATSVAKGLSVYTDKLGEQVASPLVTAIDDGQQVNGWGSLNYDDEGHKTQKNILIEDGILKSYLVDKLNGKKMGMASTGSARRQSYKFAPTSRMTNTYIANGASTKEEIIANTPYGLYAKYMGGGSVDTNTGEFNFAVMEGYMVRDGKLAEPVRGATLIGTGFEVLQNIDMVGNNMTQGHGMCGSVSGSIPANVGQPTLRVKEILVGGRNEG